MQGKFCIPTNIIAIKRPICLTLSSLRQQKIFTEKFTIKYLKSVSQTIEITNLQKRN